MFSWGELYNSPIGRSVLVAIERDGVPQPAPAPRFSRTAGEVQRSAPWPGQNTDEALGDWGLSADEVSKLRETGAIA